MIVTICAIAASVGSAIFAAHKTASPKTEKVILSPIDSVSLVREHNLLSKALIDELNRMKASKQKNPDELESVTKALTVAIRTAWPAKAYYGNNTVTPFLNVLKASTVLTCTSLQERSLTNEYLELVKGVIETLIPDCSEAVVRGEDGDNVNDFTFNCMERVKHQTSKLELHTRKVLQNMDKQG